MLQDAYYYLYGQNLSLSSFDHPRMIGYILRFLNAILGSSIFIVKFAYFFVTSLMILSFYKLGSYFLSKEKLQKAFIVWTSHFKNVIELAPIAIKVNGEKTENFSFPIVLTVNLKNNYFLVLSTKKKCYFCNR